MPDPTPVPNDDPATALCAGARDLHGLLRVAQALVREGRAVELAGLEEQVGRLCAGVLDLPTEPGRRLRPDLITLLVELEALAVLVRARPT